ncbi:MAG: toprim domain-containing protein [Candidatus Liptonbacteria bacterium]
MTLPTSIKNVIEELSKLPSIGPRQATRLAFFLVNLGAQDIAILGKSISALANLKLCERCFMVHDNQGSTCNICADENRDQSTIMIMEKETDLLSVENTRKFRGRYLIVGPIGKIGILEDWQKLRLQALKTYIAKQFNGKAKEIILAFNPTSHGDLSAGSIAKELAPLTDKVSRLGRGLPTGGEIEFADEETLGSAVERRS